jgi:hypothetical protein
MIPVMMMTSITRSFILFLLITWSEGHDYDVLMGS